MGQGQGLKVIHRPKVIHRKCPHAACCRKGTFKVIHSTSPPPESSTSPPPRGLKSSTSPPPQILISLQVVNSRYQQRCAREGAPVDNFRFSGIFAPPQTPSIGVRFAHVTSIGRGAVAPSQTLPKRPTALVTTGTGGSAATENQKTASRKEIKRDGNHGNNR